MADEDHVKVPNARPRNEYVADGQQTTFSFTFPILQEAHLAVYLNDTQASSGFNIIGERETDGGVVFFDQAPAAGTNVTLLRDVPIERMSDFQEGAGIITKTLNDDFDHLTTGLQDVSERVHRSVTLEPTDSDADLQLPLKAERANKLLGFDTDGNAVSIATSGGTGNGAEPGGSDTQVQFNDNGLLGGTSGLTYAKSTDTLSVAGDVRTDVLGENTADAGVTVDGVLAKDGKIASGHITPPGSDSEVLFNDGGSIGTDKHMYFQKSTNTLRVTGSVRTNWLYEHVGGAGVTIDQIKVVDTGVQADSLDEISPDAGVTVEGVLIKDGQVDGRDVATDGAKLDGIEAGATADQTGTEIVTSINTELGGTTWQGGGSGGTSDHGSLSGLGDDDHPQYHTDARADAWLAARTSDSVAEGTTNKYMTLAGSGAATTAARSDHNHAGSYAASNHTHPGLVPSGGGASQVLAKGSNANHNLVWQDPPPSGEVNTASNVNVGGIGVFKGKSGTNFEFRGIMSGSSRVSMGLNDTTNEIDLDVSEANLNLANMGGSLGSNAAHGVRGGGGLHATATTATGGFMSPADKAKLDGIDTGAQVNAVTDVFGRAGSVIPAAGDYTASQINNDSAVAGATVGDALESLETQVQQIAPDTNRAIVAPATDDPSISLELPAAVDRRDFLFAFTATGAAGTTQVATAADVDNLVARGISVVPSMAALSSPTDAANIKAQGVSAFGDLIVFLRGYHAPLDGGEGFFSWDPAATDGDNGGTVIAPNPASPGRWKRATNGGPTNVKWFDTIANAINFTNTRFNNNLTTTLYFPAQDSPYDLSGVTVPKHVGIVGDGEKSRISGNPTFTSIATSLTGTVSSVVFENGITLVNCRNRLFSNVWFKDTVKFDENWSSYLTFLQCAWNDADPAIDGGSLSTFVKILSCKINMPDGATNPSLDLKGGTGWVIRDTSFEGDPDAQSPYPPFMDLAGNRHTISGCWIERPYSAPYEDAVVLRGNGINFQIGRIAHYTPINDLGDLNTITGVVWQSTSDYHMASQNSGVASVSTDANGEAKIKHKLFKSPRSASVSIKGDSSRLAHYINSDTEHLTVKITDLEGINVTSGSYDVSWYGIV